MPSTNAVVRGHCRCGELRFEVSAPPVATFACHCTGCQRMTASAFSLSALYPSAAFAVTAGTPVLGGLRRELQHFFCPACMSWLYTRPPGLEDFVNVRATLLEDAASFEPFIETWTLEKLPWATTPAVHRFERFPPPEEFPALLSDYQRRSAARAP
jgi:hypothetical protein